MASEIKVGDMVKYIGLLNEQIVVGIDGELAWLKLADGGGHFTAKLSNCRPVPKPFAEVRASVGEFGLYVGGAPVTLGYVDTKFPKKIADAINAAHAEAVKAAVEQSQKAT